MMARVYVLLVLSIWMVSADPVVYIQGAIEITFPGSVTIQDLQTSTYQTVLASALMNLTGAPAGSVTIGIVPGPQTTTTTTIASTAGPSATTVGPSGTAGRYATTVGPSGTAGPYATTVGPSGTAGPSASTAGPSASTAGPSATTVGPSATTAGPSASTAGPSASTAGPSASTAGPSASTTTDPNMITTTKTTTTQAAGRRLAVHVSLKYSIKTTQSKAAAIQTQLLKAKAQFDSILNGAAYKDPTIAKALAWLVVHNVQTPVQSATTVTTTTRTYPVASKKMGTNKTGTNNKTTTTRTKTATITGSLKVTLAGTATLADYQTGSYNTVMKKAVAASLGNGVAASDVTVVITLGRRLQGRRLAQTLKISYSVKTTLAAKAAVITAATGSSMSTEFAKQVVAQATAANLASQFGNAQVLSVAVPVALTTAPKAATTTKAATSTKAATGTSKMGTSKMGTNITNDNMSLDADGAQPAAVLSGIIGLMLSANYFH